VNGKCVSAKVPPGGSLVGRRLRILRTVSARFPTRCHPEGRGSDPRDSTVLVGGASSRSLTSPQSSGSWLDPDRCPYRFAGGPFAGGPFAGGAGAGTGVGAGGGAGGVMAGRSAGFIAAW
jgi:hypothetical protein